SVPVAVCAVGGSPCGQPLAALRQVAAGDRFSIARTASGEVWSWGANNEDQLGDGTGKTRRLPVGVCAPGQQAPCPARLDGVVGVAVGAYHSAALRTDGSVWAWGDPPFADSLAEIGLTAPVPIQL